MNGPLRSTRPLLALVAVVLLAASGCGGGGGGKPAEPSRSSAEAVAAVREFDARRLEAARARLNEASFADPAAVRELAPFLTAQNQERRWAAVYLASLLVDDEGVDVLRPVLHDREVALRVLAAGALAGLGVVESLPVLVAALGTSEQLPYTDPPRRAAELAREALEAYTGESFVTEAAWRAWWVRSRGSIRWDGKRYVTG